MAFAVLLIWLFLSGPGINASILVLKDVQVIYEHTQKIKLTFFGFETGNEVFTEIAVGDDVFLNMDEDYQIIKSATIGVVY